VRETWEFVNLYSVYRGGNRFTSLIKVFELLSENHAVKNTGYVLPDLTSLKSWTVTETKLGNLTLRRYCETNPDPILEKILRWSEAVNSDISLHMRSIPPFPGAIEAIKKSSEYADLVIVSQTPLEALEREWEENNLRKYIRTIAGQEHGTKSEHISMAAKGKYTNNKILMIGDAKGDLVAAKNNGILFYPIIPGKENKSWVRFNGEFLEKFLDLTYEGSCENLLIDEFLKSLPEKQ